jgi:hypothetical protein
MLDINCTHPFAEMEDVRRQLELAKLEKKQAEAREQEAKLEKKQAEAREHESNLGWGLPSAIEKEIEFQWKKCQPAHAGGRLSLSENAQLLPSLEPAPNNESEVPTPPAAEADDCLGDPSDDGVTFVSASTAASSIVLPRGSVARKQWPMSGRVENAQLLQQVGAMTRFIAAVQTALNRSGELRRARGASTYEKTHVHFPVRLIMAAGIRAFSCNNIDLWQRHDSCFVKSSIFNGYGFPDSMICPQHMADVKNLDPAECPGIKEVKTAPAAVVKAHLGQTLVYGAAIRDRSAREHPPWTVEHMRAAAKNRGSPTRFEIFQWLRRFAVPEPGLLQKSSKQDLCDRYCEVVKAKEHLKYDEARELPGPSTSAASSLTQAAPTEFSWDGLNVRAALVVQHYFPDAVDIPREAFAVIDQGEAVTKDASHMCTTDLATWVFSFASAAPQQGWPVWDSRVLTEPQDIALGLCAFLSRCNSWCGVKSEHGRTTDVGDAAAVDQQLSNTHHPEPRQSELPYPEGKRDTAAQHGGNDCESGAHPAGSRKALSDLNIGKGNRNFANVKSAGNWYLHRCLEDSCAENHALVSGTGS